MPLSWETPAVGPTLGYDADGVEVASVVQRPAGWEAWYDRAGLERPPQAPFGRHAPAAGSGCGASAGEAMDEADRCHDGQTGSTVG